MLDTILNLFKANPYEEISKIMQGIHFILDIFANEKLVNGETSRDAALDSIIAILQTEKSTYVAPVVAPALTLVK